MSQRNTSTSIFFCIFSLFVYTTVARHAHRRPLHKHAVRADTITTVSLVPTITSTEASLPSFTAGNAVIDDVLKIQTGLNELPEDLLSFIVALEQRLAEVEKLLSGYVETPGTGSDSPVGPVGPVLSPAPPAATEDTTSESSLVVSTSAPAPSSTTSLWKPLGGAGPLRPCGEPDATAFTTTRSTRVTQTRTYLTTIPPALPLATGIRSNDSIPAVSGTIFTPPAPWIKPTVAIPTFENSFPPPRSSFEQSTSSESPTATPTLLPYTFDADSEDNVAVYYGTNLPTTDSGLSALCGNPDVDIVILSFLYSFFDANGYPSLELGSGCVDASPAQASTAPGLQDCRELANDINTCQSTYGKKVLLSLGGYNSNTSFASDDQATSFATTLWDLFGAGTGLEELRPFGSDTILDGFDIDNENHNTDHYDTFATALRNLYDTDSSKTYYLSAAPQCPIPDESIPPGALQQADFVWVQFYNNPSCNLDSPGFAQSFRAWSDLLAEGSTSGGPRLYIGAAAFPEAGSGYVKGSGLGSRVRTARGLYVENLGGVMLWSGSEAVVNVDLYGVDYLKYAKEALH